MATVKTSADKQSTDSIVVVKASEAPQPLRPIVLTDPMGSVITIHNCNNLFVNRRVVIRNGKTVVVQDKFDYA